MSLTSTEVRLAPNGHVYLANFGAAAPTDATAALDTAFNEIGYVDEKGVSITPKITTADINAWQSAVPVKQGIKTVSLTFKMNLLQDNSSTAGAWFLDQSFVSNTGGAKLILPAAPTLLERALVVEWVDDKAVNNRLYVARCIVTDRDALTLDRSNAVAYGLTISALADASANIATFFTNNTNYLVAS